MMNSFGNIFRLTSFGESHGAAIGGVIDGVPAGLKLDIDKIQHQLDRRRPGQSRLTTQRDEADRLIILSGVYEGVTTGAPIGFMVNNTNQRSADYGDIARAFRPGHADYTLHVKSGGTRDPRGGGRSSARETLTRVVAGAIAAQILDTIGVKIQAYTSAVGDIALADDYHSLDLSRVDDSPSRCPATETARRIERLIAEVRDDGDTIGGVVTCVVSGCPVGLGEPVFGRLNQMLGSAMLSINAVKGFEVGMGFDGARRRGSEVIDAWRADDADPRGVRALANHSGGIQGGLSNGEDIVMRVAFKPVATLLRDVDTVDTNLRDTTLKARGRHDPCVVPRAVPVVEAMAAMVIVDAWLMDKTRRL